MKFGKNDIRLILVLAVIALAAFAGIHFLAGKNGTEVTITVNGEEYGQYSLAKNQEIPVTVDGITTNIVTIADGYATMSEANCPDKLCIHQSAIHKLNQTIVCLPNKVVVSVTGGSSSEYDSIAR